MADVTSPHPVFTQGVLAECLRISTRRIRQLEAEGLPTLGKDGRARLYPLHAVRWYLDYCITRRIGPWGYRPLPAQEYEADR